MGMGINGLGQDAFPLSYALRRDQRIFQGTRRDVTLQAGWTVFIIDAIETITTDGSAVALTRFANAAIA
jgi:hypothetical protein